MKKSLFVIVPIGIILFWVFRMSGNESLYIDDIKKTRAERVEYLENDAGSPFKKFQKKFVRPNYFPISSDFRVTAKVQKIKKRESILITNSEGNPTKFEKYAILNFKLKGEDHQLLVLRPRLLGTEKELFCGFTDNTTGTSTYAGGRYIDVQLGKANRVVLDFNLAYNPYKTQ